MPECQNLQTVSRIPVSLASLTGASIRVFRSISDLKHLLALRHAPELAIRHASYSADGHGDAGLGDLPGGLGTGQTAADDMNRREAHEGPHSNDLRTSRAGPCRRPARAPSFSAHGRRLQAVQAFGARIGELR